MSGKGGGKDTPARGKSSFKTPSSHSGSLMKDGTSKKQEKILFESPENSDSDSEGFIEEKIGYSSKSGGKGSTEMPKFGKKSSLEDLKTGRKAFAGTPTAKGGKDGNSGKSGGKGSVPTGLPKVLVELDVPLDANIPKNAEIMLDCEAAAILQGIQEYLPSLTRDPLLKMPTSFIKALQHANNGDHYANPESVRQILEKLISKGLTEGEICMIARICPETTDELFAVVPSLKGNRQKNEVPIKAALAELAKLKKSI